MVLTRHALDKMAELGVTKEQIKTTLLRGSKIRQTDGFLASYTYLRVAYKKIGENIYKIKTVYME